MLRPTPFVLAITIALGASTIAARAADPSPVPSATATATAAASSSSDPCLSLGDLVSRPTFSTSACVVKRHALLVQTGYTNATTGGNGGSNLVTFPQEALSTGIAQNVEFDLTPPSLARLSAGGFTAGDTDGSIGIKVQVGQTSKVIYGFNTAYTLQNGTPPFTGSGDGILANINGSLSLSPALGLFGSVGYNEQSVTAQSRTHDFQPSLGASLSLPQSFAVFLEGFNQSSTGPGSGGLFAFDTGLQKDVGSRLQLDAEYYDYLTVRNGAHEHSIGFGASYLFGP